MEGIKLYTTNSINAPKNASAGVYNSLSKGAYDVKQDSFTPTKEKCQNPIYIKFDSFLAKNAPKLFIDKYINIKTLEKALSENPEIVDIIKSKGIEPKIYLQNVTGKNQEHFLTTYDKAKELGKCLPDEELNILMQAALLHDIGKAFIPSEILNKNGKLTDREREIVDIHAKLGEAILKTTNLSPKVAHYVGLHHTPSTSPLKASISAHILSAADVYSALKEERPYKTKFSDEEVKNIMENDSKLNQGVVKSMFEETIPDNYDKQISIPA